jgi:hypothetical protein
MLKKLGVPALALGAMLALASPKPADAKVHFGVYVGPPYYSYPYPYPGPYNYPYYYGGPGYYGYWGGYYGHAHYHHYHHHYRR